MNKPVRNDVDPVAEVRRIREAQAAKLNYSIEAIFADAKSREGTDGRKVVNLREQALKKTPRAGR
jgi:hypothetical protein